MEALPLFRSPAIDIFSFLELEHIVLPVMPGISAGFPSPAADFIDTSIDLSKEIVIDMKSTPFLGCRKM